MFVGNEPMLELAGLTLLGVAIVLAVAAALVVLGARLLPILRQEEQGYYYEAQIEALLLPWAFKAIAGAYRLSEHAADELGQRLAGLNKKEIADALYDMLPAQIGNVPVGVVKTVISRDRFAELVQAAFDEFMEFYTEQQDVYDDLFNAWQETNII
jgi:hypothetical protein